MKARIRAAVRSLVFATAILDSLALVVAVFAAIVNVYGTQPIVSAWSLVLAVGVLVVLALTATVAGH